MDINDVEHALDLLNAMKVAYKKFNESQLKVTKNLELETGFRDMANIHINSLYDDMKEKKHASDNYIKASDVFYNFMKSHP